MPKTAYDFTREMVFYLIKCNDESVADCYCGSTFDFLRRKAQHKTVCNNENSKHHNLKIYQGIRDNGGWSNFSMTMIDRKIVKDKLEARQHEQTLIDTHKTKLNTIRAYISEEQRQKYKAEYRDSHKEESSKREAEYRDSHKEEINKQNAEYRASHKEEISKQKAEYYVSHKKQRTEYKASNREEINKYQAEYYASRKEEISKYQAEYRAKKKALHAESTPSLDTTEI
jgi:membrane protein involved in colicin uptake